MIAQMKWFRMSLYFLIPFLVIFKAETADWTGDEWVAAHWFIKTKVFMNCFIGASGAAAAFYDDSFHRLRTEKERRAIEKRALEKALEAKAEFSA